jgi:hypothetical protein
VVADLTISVTAINTLKTTSISSVEIVAGTGNRRATARLALATAAAAIAGLTLWA